PSFCCCTSHDPEPAIVAIVLVVVDDRENALAGRNNKELRFLHVPVLAGRFFIGFTYFHALKRGADVVLKVVIRVHPPILTTRLPVIEYFKPGPVVKLEDQGIVVNGKAGDRLAERGLQSINGILVTAEHVYHYSYSRLAHVSSSVVLSPA